MAERSDLEHGEVIYLFILSLINKRWILKNKNASMLEKERSNFLCTNKKVYKICNGQIWLPSPLGISLLVERVLDISLRTFQFWDNGITMRLAINQRIDKRKSHIKNFYIVVVRRACRCIFKNQYIYDRKTFSHNKSFLDYIIFSFKSHSKVIETPCTRKCAVNH